MEEDWDDDRLLTAKQMGEYLQLDETWILRNRDRYGLPYVKTGHEFRFPRRGVVRRLREVSKEMKS